MTMDDKTEFNLLALPNDNGLVLEALRKGAREAMKRHIVAGVPMVSWENGQIVEIPPIQLEKILRDKNY
ncbi:MAG: hypothetical protein LBR11_03220 [Deltaproteobacteria bacterium]|nr:hypothetical protein [Deltaproteobacteria bacterium]